MTRKSGARGTKDAAQTMFLMTEESTAPPASPFRLARKFAVAVIGFGVLAFGMALIVLPGPASLVIPLALAILATEFLWARRLLQPIQRFIRYLKSRARDTLGRLL